ncbi:MAG: YqiA/YcfP family alpha/beta fold hydrolase [Betaproteobacteria bacterium]
MNTIVYLHGFRSSPASVKAVQFRDAVAMLPAARRPQLHVPDLTFSPAAAMRAVTNWLVSHADSTHLTFVGSSLGGFYATYLAERLSARAVLINPAVNPHLALAPWLGVQTNLHTGAPFEVTNAHFDELAALRVTRITRPARYFLLVETGDEVLDYREAVAFYGGGYQYLRGGGDHAFGEFVTQIPAILHFAGVGDAR